MSENIESLNTIFQALSDPTRRAIIRRLGTGPASTKELAQPFNMALPSFMKHLSVLEKSGLIATEKTGRVRTCRIKPQKFQYANNWIETQMQLWEERTDRLASYVEALDVDKI